MKSFSAKLSSLFIVLAVFLAACTKDAEFSKNLALAEIESASGNNGGVIAEQVPGAKYIPDAYIVVLKDDVADVDAEVEAITKALGGKKAKHKYKHALKGFSIDLPAAAMQALAKNPKVKYIEQDQIVTVVNTIQANPTWGLDRVDQRDLPLSSSYTYASNGSTVDAYIFDTGIRSGHTEFGGRVKTGFVASDIFPVSTEDVDGHGTHVAGTVGGTTYGIAKAINLIPVKVLGDNGSGSWSGVIGGLDWAVSHHQAGKPAVGNMSLGGGFSSTVNAAVVRAINDGIVMCVAAGNSSADAKNYSPASTLEAITVGATTSSDARASYSNFGPVVDIFAPGSAILSAGASSNTSIATLSGTSMASPHVAGVTALYLEANPGATPAQVQAGIKAIATPNKVTNPGTGSPNLLLFFGSAGTPPPATPPAAPTLLSPSNGATGRPVTSSSVSWSASTGTVTYTVELSTSTSFTEPLLRNSVTTTSTSFSGLSALTTYYWRVGATNAAGTTWSSTWSFTTALAVPTLASPANSATGVSLTPQLSWNTTGAASYDVQVATNSKFVTSSLVIDQTTPSSSVKGTFLNVTTPLRSGTTYFWRVRSRSANGTLSSYSSSRRFTTR